MTTAAETRAVVSWAGPGESIVLTLYGPEGEVAVPLLPKRALTLAQELLTRGVQAIKVDWPHRRRAGAARGDLWPGDSPSAPGARKLRLVKSNGDLLERRVKRNYLGIR